ncbi:ATP synthase subunit delta [Halobacillus andaensis]|uniref:ATP synthase subunit delta n=1 Tax=Halobacillus andaensis TaxID=1176239 RepID=A0A917B4S6_HALAA|nr:F0F1 ATP synthase subunit delta [Halobacillus andaensis]MBP2004401.1 F-type H+-transporting ATPase subunit delta [Halobacillus andaensis]GGF21921.1 ATP synthase subunit delta [Halobacillus andaensis]
MSEIIVAKRYANALFQLGQERSKLEQIETELRALREIFQKNKGLVKFLKHPRLAASQKKQLLNDSLQGFSKETLNTLMLLIDRHREEIILDMTDHFILKMNDIKGIADATVYSVNPLSEVEKQRISETFAPKVGKQSLNLTNVVDKKILGGIRLRVGNRIFDGSVSGKLNRIERQLVSPNNR